MNDRRGDEKPLPPAVRALQGLALVLSLVSLTVATAAFFDLVDVGLVTATGTVSTSVLVASSVVALRGARDRRE